MLVASLEFNGDPTTVFSGSCILGSRSKGAKVVDPFVALLVVVFSGTIFIFTPTENRFYGLYIYIFYHENSYQMQIPVTTT